MKQITYPQPPKLGDRIPYEGFYWRLTDGIIVPVEQECVELSPTGHMWRMYIDEKVHYMAELLREDEHDIASLLYEQHKALTSENECLKLKCCSLDNERLRTIAGLEAQVSKLKIQIHKLENEIIKDLEEELDNMHKEHYRG